MSDRSELALASVRLLAEGRAVLAGLDDAVFGGVPPVQLGTVATHFRHCLDFYLCFLSGLEAGMVDYEARRREAALERDRRRALEAAGELEARLAQLPAALEERELAVRRDGEGSALQRSTVGRELLFLASHTVHHYALIGALLRLQGVEPGAEFGVAPSTLEHRRRQAER